MGKVRVGFAGVGFMGQVAHLRNYVRNPECEVVALAEPRPELARRVAAKYGIEKQVGYISTGGGAFLEVLEGKTLPAFEILQRRAAG